jgi:glycosyltransferase involved in cell wall biosynthesis
MKKKILIMANKLDVGGVQKSLISLLQSIDYQHYEVDLVLRDQGAISEYLPSEVRIIEPPDYYEWIFLPKNPITTLVKSLGLNLNFLRVVFFMIKGLLSKNMGQSRQQLLQSCMHTLQSFDGTYDAAIDYTGNFKALLLNKVRATRKISWLHSDYRVYGRDKDIDLKDYGQIDTVVVVSETCYNIFVSEFPQYRDKCVVMPNISLKSQIQIMAMDRVDFDSDFSGAKILSITRLDPNKGLEIAMKACKKLVCEGYDVKWYVLGDGPERERIEKMVHLYGLKDRFILLGFKVNPYPYIKQADIIVHSSLFEGKSVAIDEAMLLAKPIIVTNYPTAKDQIQDGFNGLICDISTDGLYDAVSLLLENTELRQRLSNNLLDYDISAEQSMQIFEKLIG